MTSFQLKALAALFMVLDHVGAVFFPTQVWLRIIGRLSFPIFAWLIAEGVFYTKNLKKYFKRILAFAFISQIPYGLLFNTFILNVLFTFSLSILLLAIISDKLKLSSVQRILAFYFIFILSFFVDGGFFGLLLPVIFYYFKTDRKLQTILAAGLIAVFTLSQYLLSNHLQIQPVTPIFIQLFSVLSLPLIFLYNQKQGPKLKYFFYIFYPLHLGILLFISEYLGRP